MVDLSSLLTDTLSGTGSSLGASTGDLATFANTAAKNDIWGQIANPLLAAKFNTATWSPQTSLGVSLAQAFLGGILKGYGENQQGEQLNKVAAVLPALYADPAHTPVPEGVDPEAFGNLKIAQLARQQAVDQAIREKIATTYGGAYDPTTGTATPIPGMADLMSSLFDSKAAPQIQARMDALAAKADANTGKQEDALRREWATPQASKELAATVSLRDAIDTLKRLKTPIGDLAMAELYNRIQAPGANAIRGSILDKTLNAQNPLNKIAGQIQEFFGGGSLSPESRRQFIDAIDAVTAERMNYYKNLADTKFRTLAENRGLDFNNIIPEYNDLFGNLSTGTSSGPSMDLGSFIAQAKAQGLSKEQARAQWQAMGGR